ncbi:MAG: hypothetical protein ACJAWL_001221 [Motiliproteus sp.]
MQIGYPADLSASAANLDPAGLFSLYFIGLEREFGAILMV